MVTVRAGKRQFNFGMEVVDELSLGIVGRAPIQSAVPAVVRAVAWANKSAPAD
jgi:hypothetical protein